MCWAEWVVLVEMSIGTCVLIGVVTGGIRLGVTFSDKKSGGMVTLDTHPDEEDDDV